MADLPLNQGEKARKRIWSTMTPTELADALDMRRRDVIARCMELGLPITNGRIDGKRFVEANEQAAPDPVPPNQGEAERSESWPCECNSLRWEEPVEVVPLRKLNEALDAMERAAMKLIHGDLRNKEPQEVGTYLDETASRLGGK